MEQALIAFDISLSGCYAEQLNQRKLSTETSKVNRRGEPQAFASDGVCEFSKLRANGVSALCIAPLRKPALTVIRFEPPAEGYPFVSLAHPPTGGSDQGGFGIWRVVQNGAMTAQPESFVMSVEVREAVGHFERELDMPGVRLKEFRER